MGKHKECIVAYEELKETVLELIGDNKVKETLEELNTFAKEFGFDAIRKDLAIMAGRYNRARHADSIHGTVTHAEADIATNTIKKGIVYEILEKIKKACEKAEKNILSKSERITINDAYCCNRETQNSTFHKRDTSQKVHAFLIHGIQGHGHKPIVKRFSHHLNTKGSFEPISIDLSRVAKCTFQDELLKKIFLEFSSGTDSNRVLTTQSLSKIYGHSGLARRIRQNSSVFVKINLPRSISFDSLIKDIQWFYNDFCKKEALPDDAPDFYFFFSIEYRRIREKKEKKIFEKIKRYLEKVKFEKQKKHIAEKIKESSISMIEELKWVKDEDIIDWLDGIHVKSPHKQEQLMKKEFGKLCNSEEYYYMDDLVPRFKKIINNQINLRL